MKWLLFPFGWLFGAVTAVRRWLFDLGVFKREKALLPTIVVGNITVGGTGKSPFTRYLAELLLPENPVILSRGYGRSTKGFREVHLADKAADCGDEPLETRQLLPESIRNFVCENRLAGIRHIVAQDPLAGLVLLDDGFQHLQLMPDAVVLLCDYTRPFFRDWPLPAGRLREFSSAARFATAIVVTKCPADLSPDLAMQWRGKLARYGLPVYFSTFVCTIQDTPTQEQSRVLLVSGLANHKPLSEWVHIRFHVAAEIHYPDHHNFSKAETDNWRLLMSQQNIEAIVTTGKDAVKIAEIATDLPLRIVRLQPRILFGGEDDLIRLLLTKIERNV